MRPIHPFLAALLIPLALTLAPAACGDDESDEAATLEKFESACEDYCVAQAASGCAMSLDAGLCEAGCAYAPMQTNGLCLEEYAASYECAAAGEFQCIMDFPSPVGAECVSEALSLSECIDTINCTSYCESAVAASCGATSADACQSQCEAERVSYDDDAFCRFEYDQLLLCWGREGVTCQNGQAGATGCESEVLSMGECLSWDSVCAGYCWAAERFGCGDGCTADCEAKVADVSCGRDYEYVLECYLRAFDEPACVNGALVVPNDCDYDLDNYDQCVAGTTP
ncbi:MAG: hypothetical protein H6713_02260 [Myxococcales bacterium]|nr:hypothetical protein [Myxococcales bacterium]MCB9748810.1 hypothetical protein [Myxococcales bacterium]